MDHRRGAGARLVGEDAALHAAPDRNGHRGSGHTADHRVAGESGFDDEPQRLRNESDVHDEDDQAETQIDDRHDGRQVGGHVGDLLHAAEDDQSVDQKDQRRYDPGDHRRVAGKAADRAVDCVDLQRTAGDQGDKDRKDRKRAAEDFGDRLLLHAAREDVHDASAEVAILVLDTEMHCQRDLRELGCHAAQRRDPHPEDRAGAAHRDGVGHAHDVAVAHAGGQRRCQGLIGSNLSDAVVRLLAHIQDHFAKSGPKAGKLHALEPDGEIQADAEEYRQHDGAEQKGSQIPQNLSDDCFHVPFSFVKKYREALRESPGFPSVSSDE